MDECMVLCSKLQFRRSMNKDIGIKLKMIDEALARNANNQLASVGLTLSQVNLLGALSQQPGRQTTQRQLETLLGVSHPTVVGLVKRLEAKEFVETHFSADDGRMKIVQLTAKGEHIVDDGAEKRGEAENWLTRGLSDAEVGQLNALLGKVLDNLQD